EPHLGSAARAPLGPARRRRGRSGRRRNVLRANARAFEQHDMKTLDRIWSHGDGVTVFENGYANYGWTDYRDHHLRPEVEEMKNVKYELSDIRARVSGATAWATFKYTIRAEYQGQTIDGAGLGT